ncbi:bifunctional diaminohydroxyphosphoribosylaminopyrimidine deaminase/5-amino-6-(5-phosphoribosylamino)uracil reductase RibD [Kushneria sp. TE3]|uniref:bifunctional diaminohydroxyphosphoribosylaminopyrimidine deaminase/5-amino-6-(5-phosphoribosylamino)uracil reductase RibD n=1 Tax=Kushneria sp. TE3 TaxID=3449832 RepID=UPI003F6859DA
MKTSNKAAFLMRQALAVSRMALPHCQPNPPVGCVLVDDGTIVARGYTQPPGQYHAEAHALSQLATAVGLEAYVTLEPCAFHGRTPSCAQALIDSGIRRVYVALIDPHPLNQGRGIEMMRRAGIEVQLGIAHDSVRRFIHDHLDVDPLYQSLKCCQECP